MYKLRTTPLNSCLHCLIDIGVSLWCIPPRYIIILKPTSNQSDNQNKHFSWLIIFIYCWDNTENLMRVGIITLVPFGGKNILTDHWEFDVCMHVNVLLVQVSLVRKFFFKLRIVPALARDSAATSFSASIVCWPLSSCSSPIELSK